MRSTAPKRIVGTTSFSPHHSIVGGLAPNAWNSGGCGAVYGLGTTLTPFTVVPSSPISPGAPYFDVIVCAGGQSGMPWGGLGAFFDGPHEGGRTYDPAPLYI